MSKENQIKDFWEKKGASEDEGKPVTHGDKEQVRLEIDAVISLLGENDTLLDVGCGNGFATSRYAEHCKKATGIDYSENMVNAAREQFADENIGFEQQDVLEIGKTFGAFSKILSTRCLINLGSWEKQKEALMNLTECVKPGGALILAEGTQQGRAALNELREKNGLETMPPVWHNIDFDEEKLRPFLLEFYDIERDIRFGLYDVITRVHYPKSIAPEEPRFGTPVHKAARELLQSLPADPLPRYSREFVWVCRKKK